MAMNPNYALQFKRTLDRASEPRKTRATGTVTAVSADSDGKIKNATVSTGGTLLSMPVPYGTNVYTGMTVAITNDGTPSNAQWRLSGTTSVPGGIQGGSIINHDGNTFAMFDSIWVRNTGVIIVGGDVDIDGNPTGPRVENNQCGYFGYDQYDRQSLAIYAAACDDHSAGDVILGPLEAARIEILPGDGTVSITYDNDPILQFTPNGNFIRKPMTIGNPVGARINIGEIDDKATFVLRDSNGVAKMVARTDDTNDIYIHVGNPPPEDNSMWFDSSTGRLNTNGHFTVQSMDVRGRATFASTGEFMIIDPDDPGHFGVITPRGQYAYTTDALGAVHLVRVDSWGPLVLENELGDGIWRTWVGGSQIFGDVRYGHFRIESGADARAGFFSGEDAIIYLDATGNGYLSGEIEVTGNVTTTNGAIIVGSGNTVLNQDGIYIEAGGIYDGRRAINFIDEADRTIAALYGVRTSDNAITLQSDGTVEGVNALTSIAAFGGTGKQGAVSLLAYGNGVSSNEALLQVSSTAAGVTYASIQVDNFLVQNAITIIGDGGSTDYSQFDATGHLTFAGTAKPWNDILIEPTARTTGATAPTFEKWYDDAAGTSRGVFLYSFDDASAGSEKEVFFTLQMSHAWDGGNVQFHVHWVGAVNDTTATPRWGLEYVWKEPGGVYADTTTVYAIGNHLSEANITAHKHYITLFTALSPGSTADDLSSVLIGRLFRNSADAADTYNASNAKCGLLYIDAHYQLARIGSNNEYSA